MDIELTVSQQQALDALNGEPLALVDPRNQHTYVLVSADEFARAQEALQQLDELASQKAITDAARKSAIKWMKENPY
jgi:hypothetical protein